MTQCASARLCKLSVSSTITKHRSATMGRPPIGKRAMTATERQRRWRAKSRANKPAPKPTASVRTVERLQARVRELEAGHVALCAAMGKLLHVIAQRPAARSKKREFRAELARLR